MNRKPSILFLAALAVGLWLAPSALLAADIETGKQKYQMFCVTCHGEQGKGDGPGGAGLEPPPRDFSKGEFKFDANKDGKPGEDEDLEMVITNGAAAYGGSPLMTPWGGALTEDDIDSVILVIRSLKQ